MKGVDILKSYDIFDVSTLHPVNIGELCKRWRIVSGLTVTEIAKYMECSPDNIYKFEQGKNNNLDLLLCYMAHGFTFDAGRLLLKKGDDES